MSVQLNHTIVWCRDKQRSAPFLANLLGLPAPTPFGPMLIVKFDNGVSLDYYDNDTISLQHYAFLLDDPTFDQVFARLTAQGCRTGRSPANNAPIRSMKWVAGAGCTSMTRTAICWKS